MTSPKPITLRGIKGEIDRLIFELEEWLVDSDYAFGTPKDKAEVTLGQIDRALTKCRRLSERLGATMERDR